MDTKSWTIYGSRRWLVAYYEIFIFQLLIRYKYKHFAPWSKGADDRLLEHSRHVLCLGQERYTFLSTWSQSGLKGDRGCCCPMFLFFPSWYTLCCIGVVLNIRIVIFVLFFVTVILQLSYTYKLCYLSYRIKGWFTIIISYNCIGDVIVSVFASSALDRGFQPLSGQTKDYKIVQDINDKE